MTRNYNGRRGTGSMWIDVTGRPEIGKSLMREKSRRLKKTKRGTAGSGRLQNCKLEMYIWKT